MCGILGSVNHSIDNTMLDQIRHRGPDDSGLVSLHIGDHSLFFGHRRLSIVDLSSTGHQPMSSADANGLLIFNGEIYNHRELRQSLVSTEFRGHSDTETILELLVHKGINAVKQFNGIFALAFVDNAHGKLFLARDPFGVKPLYYCQNGNEFLFGSEIKPLQSICRDAVDKENLAELLRLRFSPSPDTLFQRIHKVRPGHIVEIDLNNSALVVNEYPYRLDRPKSVQARPSNLVEHYGQAFEEAVERQLMADVEVGILLSGGIDSALVAAVAQKRSLKPLKAFTIGFSETDDSDEIDDARETAEILGMEHHVVRMGFDDFLGSIKKCVNIVEEPVATTSVIPMYHLSELASQHVKVVLSGQGADEPLGGYGRYQGELYRKFCPPFLAQTLKPLVQFVGVKSERILRGLNALSHLDDLPRFLRTYEVFNQNEVERLTGVLEKKAEQRLSYTYDLLGCHELSTSVERMMSLDLRMNLSDDLLLYTDKITMHHSLECRVPMLDLDLIQFVESLPADCRVKRNRTKIIHRDYAAKVLPTAIINRRKKGFQSPTKSWFRKSEVHDILLDPASRFANYFDLREVGGVLDQHLSGYDRERQIFLLLSIHCWMHDYDVMP